MDSGTARNSILRKGALTKVAASRPHLRRPVRLCDTVSHCSLAFFSQTLDRDRRAARLIFHDVPGRGDRTDSDRRSRLPVIEHPDEALTVERIFPDQIGFVCFHKVARTGNMPLRRKRRRD